ncbi:MAG: hypothetical protein ACYTJ0_06965 [Planctomycetota bacterium]|jgi:hypothetical protein
MTMEHAVAAARIAFGLVFLLKLAHSIDARELVWAHRGRTSSGSDLPLRAGLALLVLAVACFTAGLATGPAALLAFLLYVVLFHYASLHCLEDILVQTLCLYFVFAGAGAELSLAAVIGTELSWGRVPPGSVIPEVALTVAMGWVLLSAGLEKVRSPLWRRGLACYYFFLLPNVRRIDTSWLTRRRTLMIALNFLTIAIEVGYLPVLLVDGRTIGLVTWVLVVGFTAMLLVVFVVDFIGEVQLIGLAITGWLLWSAAEDGLAAAAMADVAGMDGAARAAGIALLLSLLPGGWAVLAPSAPALPPPLRGVNRALRTMARYSWGTMPVTAFTELHLRGPVVYEVLAPDGAGGRQVAWPIFNDRCRPGPARRLRPTFFETMAYKVTDVCVELDRHGRLSDPARERFIRRLAEFAARKAERRLGRRPSTLVFRITQIQPPAEFVGPSEWYLKDWRLDGFCVDLDGGAAVGVRALARPILKYPTGRDLDRVSFRFAVA